MGNVGESLSPKGRGFREGPTLKDAARRGKKNYGSRAVSVISVLPKISVAEKKVTNAGIEPATSREPQSRKFEM